jgi:hypothetical protein
LGGCLRTTVLAYPPLRLVKTVNELNALVVIATTARFSSALVSAIAVDVDTATVFVDVRSPLLHDLARIV